jgi:hypothetical protein
MTVKGFKYFVSEEQVKIHQQRSVKEILQWLHETNYFLKNVQNDDEKNMMKQIKENLNTQN